MTTVTILHKKSQGDEETYWAVAPKEKLQTVGRSAGEALDALNAQMISTETGSFIIVQREQSDIYFTEKQLHRLQELIALSATEAGLTSEEEAERDSLIEAEFMASAQRTSDLADALGR